MGWGHTYCNSSPSFVSLSIKHIMMVYMDATIAGSWRNPPSKHQIQPECGGAWTDWRETGRPNLSRETRFWGAKWDEEKPIYSLYSWPQAGLAMIPGWSIHCWRKCWPYCIILYYTLLLPKCGDLFLNARDTTRLIMWESGVKSL